MEQQEFYNTPQNEPQNPEPSEAEYNDMPTEPKKTSPKKHHGFRNFLIFMAVIVLVWWFNNFTLRTSEYKVYSDEIVQPFRIAVLSDYHATEYGIDNDDITEEINEADPDLVFMLGDMYSRRDGWDRIQIPIDLVAQLTKQGHTVYFVPGEHDTSERYLSEVAAAGAHVMSYKGEIINVKGNNVQILGIDNVYYSPTFDLNNAFSLAENCFTILMAHIPYYQAFAEFGADLTICGDTHGGIIQLPFDRGPAYYSRTGEWLPELTGNRSDVYDKGMFPYKGGSMFITSGIGGYPVPARFNNRPEIAVIDIEPY